MSVIRQQEPNESRAPRASNARASNPRTAMPPAPSQSVPSQRAAVENGAGGRTTIQQVADHAGVSIGTVSRVLNRRPGVSAPTQQRVQASIDQLAYRPDQAARALSKAPLRIGLSLAAGTRRLTPFFMLFLEHLTLHLQQGGYRFEEVAAGAHDRPAWPYGGVIVHGARADDPRLRCLERRGVPFVLVGRAPGARWVAPDDQRGGYEATRHLLELGHREIVLLGGLMSEQAFQDRHAGYLQALHEADQLPDRRWLLDGDFTTLGGYRAVRRAFEAGSSATAIFAASDEMALGAVAALQDLGLEVPRDVSVVGFDDLPEVSARLSVPHGLTTVRQEIATITASAVSLLEEGLRGGPIRSETIPVQLIVRGTTAPRRG